MAGTVVHLVVADRLLEQLEIKNPSLFYCGNLAPDAIMGRENYTREMKNHTHFKEGQKPYTFRIKENQESYLKRLLDFAGKYLKPGSPEFELYLGYIVHILVDELFLLDYYEEILKELETKGISPADEEFSRAFVHDVDQVDWELVRGYSFKYEMPAILFQENSYEITGWITNNELIGSKHFITHRNFITPHEREELKVSTYERNFRFIDYCVDRIPDILRERFSLMLSGRPETLPQ